MTELDSVERLLTLARVGLSPSAAEKLRTRAALQPLDAAARGAGRPESPSPCQTVPWQAVRASGKAAGLVALVLVGSSVGAGYWLGQRGAEPLRPQATVAAAAGESTTRPGATLAPPVLLANPLPAAPPQPPVRGAEPARERLARVPAVPAPARPRAATSTAAGAVSVDELALLRRVERALRSAEPALALGLLAELDERFPQTELGEEREAAAVIAHCRLADAGAQQRAQRFLREHAASVYAERLRAACAPENIGPGETREGSPPAGDE